MSDAPTLTVPTVHLNGTSREELLAQCLTALRGFDAAEKGLAGMSPNGRDHYPAGPDAIRKAQAEHLDRAKRLRTIRDEIEFIAEAIA